MHNFQNVITFVVTTEITCAFLFEVFSIIVHSNMTSTQRETFHTKKVFRLKSACIESVSFIDIITSANRSFSFDWRNVGYAAFIQTSTWLWCFFFLCFFTSVCFIARRPHHTCAQDTQCPVVDTQQQSYWWFSPQFQNI